MIVVVNSLFVFFVDGKVTCRRRRRRRHLWCCDVVMLGSRKLRISCLPQHRCVCIISCQFPTEKEPKSSLSIFQKKIQKQLFLPGVKQY